MPADFDWALLERMRPFVDRLAREIENTNPNIRQIHFVVKARWGREVVMIRDAVDKLLKFLPAERCSGLRMKQAG